MIKLADGRGHLYQWDTGRQVECDAEQVHFSNHHYGTSIDVDVQNGKATIPNQLLTSATPLKAWAWVTDSNGEYTKEEQIFAVAKRNKPSDYVYTPTEIKTWQDLQNQIGDLNSLTTAHKDNLVNAINDAAGSGGGGASDFIIKMTVTSDDNGNYTVTSCDATVEQIDAAISAEKRVVVIATDTTSGVFWEIPIVQAEGEICFFSAFLNGVVIFSYVQKVAENESKWQFVVVQIEAGNISYSNDALPNISTVGGALDELVPKSHTHANKGTLDKLSDSNGKLQYNGSDVGLKGADGITPTIGTNGNWYLDTTDTGKPSRGEKGDKGDPGSDANVTKANVITALGYTPKAVSAQVTTGSNITLADNTEYRLTDVTTLTLTYPAGNFECWLKLTFAASGNATVTLPTGTKYIGTTPDFKNGETWEMSIKDGVVIAQKVGDGT